mmetsp:Transcript_23448/g.51478  ORF Transcript_23448/g.51478 Transcript_23448/m.51478 type:complete len:388 (+) Transcript_23448:97-1260(+)|eukprot:CAMPEP_0202902686 /NCGR_PEP_ID=MMETSP1392-20130828/16998_1 /ASSEMBLY_ACC=CAM_ASM_000868 /TAXON_ID=225041 /ORGANISM="Chlamydomonas chlamydogama, Strain SAG 11-48b" /LENGTH=387 /DNA_ID=CAMNT_0049589491 /DNA_START=66 /DNA_END=1229 /DNA_ORIENTATION=+
MYSVSIALSLPCACTPTIAKSTVRARTPSRTALDISCSSSSSHSQVSVVSSRLQPTPIVDSVLGFQGGPASASRRGSLLGLLALGLSASSSGQALARLTSVDSLVPCVLTIKNQSKQVVKVVWLNYDGDPECYTVMGPKSEYIIDTFETHPWQLVDPATDKVVKQVVARRGDDLLQITDADFRAVGAGKGTGKPDRRPASGPASEDPVQDVGERFPSEGFDGLGREEAAYVTTELSRVIINLNEDIGFVTLKIDDGKPKLISMLVSPEEAKALVLAASGSPTRRPSTVSAWQSSIQASGGSVVRVVITRIMADTLYARVLINNGNQDKLASVDVRPSDGMALALACHAPIFMSKQVAEELAQEEGTVEFDYTDKTDALVNAGSGFEA